MVTRVLVTGASGFVGGRLLRDLIARDGFDVCGLARRSVPWLEGVPLWQMDIVGAGSALERALDGVDSVVHLAGANEVRVRADAAAAEETVRAAQQLGRACRRVGVARLVYLSTVHVYGSALAPGAVVDERCTTDPLTPYSASRLEVERLLQAELPDAQVVVARLSNSVGSPVDLRVDRWTLLVNDLCRQAVTAGKLRLATAGQQWRDFVAVEDVCEVLAGAGADRLAPGVYNVASGRSRTVRTVAGMVQEAARRAGLGDLPLHAPEAIPPEEAPFRVSVEKLAVAGYTPRISLQQAIDQVLGFCLCHREALSESAPRLPGGGPRSPRARVR